MDVFPTLDPPTEPASSRIRWLDHQGRSVLLFDFSNVLNVPYSLQIVEEGRRLVASLPRVQSLITLVDVSDANFDPEAVEACKALAVHNKPWVIASAVVGLSPIRRVVLRVLSAFAKRKFGTFVTREQAMDWLVQQKAPPTEVPEMSDA